MAAALFNIYINDMDRDKRIWYLSPMRAAKVQASLRIRAVSPEPSLLAHISSESRGTFRQKARSLAPLNGWACAVKICHDGMLEDTNSLDGAHIVTNIKSTVRLFADDTSLYLIVDEPDEAARCLNSDLELIYQRAERWLVKFNAAKSESLSISRKANKPYHPPLFKE